MITIRQVQTDDRNTNQLQENIKQAVEAPFMEDVGQFTAVLSGLTANVTCQVMWQTGTTQSGVILSFAGIAGTSNTTSLSVTGLPTNLYPKTVQASLAVVQDNGTNLVGLCYINTNGTIDFYTSVSAGAFTASGSKGIGQFTIAYVRGV